MKGAYTVFFRLEQTRIIEIGALGEIKFESGLYAYTGSGQTNVEKRVKRHLGDSDSLHWHIDYFSRKAEPVDQFIIPGGAHLECRMAEILSELGEPVQSFGCSDCDCNSHLFRFPEDF